MDRRNTQSGRQTPRSDARATAARRGRRAAALPGAPRTLPRGVLLVSTALVGLIAAAPAFANPEGGRVVAGTASIVRTSPTRLDINQATDRTVIDWQRFSIAPGEHTNFNQPGPGSIAFNRVVTADPSTIAGRLTANGRIVLINPSGVVFTEGAQVNVQSLIATTANISNSNAMAGRLQFDQPSAVAGARVVNAGEITVREGGIAALVGPEVANSGVIRAEVARVVLGGAETFAVDLAGDGLLSFQLGQAVQRQPRDAAGNPRPVVENTGRIEADGGSVLLSARAAANIVGNVVNAGGAIIARSVHAEGGTVVFGAEGPGTVAVTGTVDVSGLGAGQSGGRVTVTGEQVEVAAGARIDARGATGGGRVLVGGNYQGSGPERNARRTRVAAGAAVDASATGSGNGGTVIVWSEENTAFAGSVVATGGPGGGDGGFVEVSSRGVLAFTGTVDLRAPAGATGTLLLDPRSITIQTGGTETVSETGGDPNTITGTDDDSILRVATLEAALAAANVIIETGGAASPGGGAGDITVADTVDPNIGGARTLTLRALGTITLEANARISSGGAGTLSVVLEGPTAGSAAAAIVQENNAHVLAGGTITMRAGTITLDAQVGGTGVGSGQASLVSLTSTAGAIDQTGGSIRAGNLVANAAGGAVTLDRTTNVIGTVAGGTTGAGDAFTVVSGTALTVDAVGISAAGDVSLTANGATADITVNGAIAAAGSTVTLTAGRDIGQGAAGAITAAALSLSATSGEIDLTTAANAFDAISGTARNGFAASAAQSFQTGAIDNTNNGGVSLSATGATSDLTLGGTVSAAGQTVTLDAGRDVLQTAAGNVTGSNLVATAGQSVVLDTAATNNVTTVTGSAGTGDFRYSNNANLTIAAGGVSAAGTAAVLSAGGGTLLTVDGNVLGASTILLGNDIVINAGATVTAGGGAGIAAFSTAQRSRPAILNGAAAGSLSIDATELTRISAGTIAISNQSLATGAGTATITVAGYNVPGGGLILDASGNIVQTGAINVARLGAISTGGSVTLTDPANAIPVLGGGAASGGSFDFLTTGTLTFDTISTPALLRPDIVGVSAAGATVTINAPGPIDQTAVGPLAAGTLAITSSAGAIDLGLAENAVASVTGSAAGPFRLVNGPTSLVVAAGGITADTSITLGTGTGGNLAVNGPLTVNDIGSGTSVTLAAGGDVTQSQPLLVGTVAASSTGGSVTLNDAGNTFTALSGGGDTGFSATTTQSLTTGAIGNATSGGISLTVTGAANTLALNGAIGAPGQTIALSADGQISQTGTGIISSGLVAATSTSDSVFLWSANNTAEGVSGSAAGFFTLYNYGGASLTVQPAGITSGTGYIALYAAGATSDLILNGPLAPGAGQTQYLFADRNISQTGGAITATLVQATADIDGNNTGAVSLDQTGNNFAAITGSAATGFSATTTQTLAVNNSITNSTSGGISLTAIGATSDIIVNVPLSVPGQTLTLDAGRDVRQGAGITLTAGNLVANAGVGSVLLAEPGNALGGAAGTSATGYYVVSSTTMEAGSITNTTSGDVRLETGAGADINVAGDINAPGQGVVLVSGGAIGTTGPGAISAGILFFSANGQVTLTGPHAVAQLSGITPGGVTFVNDPDLEVMGFFGLAASGDVRLSVTDPGALLTVTSPIGGSNVELVADRMAINAGVGNGGSTAAVLRPASAGRTMIVGGAPTVAEETANLALSSAELALLNGSRIRLGEYGTASAAGDMEVRIAGLGAAATGLFLETGGAISQTAGAISIGTLGFAAGGDVALTRPGNSVGTLAGVAGGLFSFEAGSAVTVGTAAGTAGFIATRTGLTTGGDSSISTAGLTLAQSVVVTGGLALDAGAGSIDQTGGTITADSLDAQAGGFVNLTAGFADLNPVPIISGSAGGGRFDVWVSGPITVAPAGISATDYIRLYNGYLNPITVGGPLYTPNAIYVLGSAVDLQAQTGGTGAGTGLSSYVYLRGNSGSVTQTAAGVVRGADGVAFAFGAGSMVALDTADNLLGGTGGNAGTTFAVRTLSNLAVTSSLSAGDTTTLTVANAGGSLTVNNPITGPNGITLTADAMAINAQVGNAGTSYALLQPFSTNRAAVLGGAGDVAGSLTLEQTELANIAAPILGVFTTGTGGMTVRDVSLGAGRTLALSAGGSISQSGTALVVENLGIIDAASVSLPGAANNISTIAAVSRGGLLVNAGVSPNMQAGTVVLPAALGGPITGLTAPGDITLSSQNLTLTEAIDIGAGTLRLYAMNGNLVQSAGAFIVAGDVFLYAPTGSITATDPANSYTRIAAYASSNIALYNSGPTAVGAVATDGVLLGGTAFGVWSFGGAGSATLQSAGAITLERQAQVSGPGMVRLRAETGDIVSTALGGVIGNVLLVADAGGIDLRLGTSNATALAGRTGDGAFLYRDTNGFTVGTVTGDAQVAGQTGIVTTNGHVSLLTATGNLALDAAVDAGAERVLLAATTGNVTQTASGTVSGSVLVARAGGQVDLTAAPNTILDVAGSAGAAGFAYAAAGSVHVADLSASGDSQVAGQNGISTADGAASIVGATGVLVEAPVSLGAGVLRLRALAGDITGGDAAAITAGGLLMRADAGLIDFGATTVAHSFGGVAARATGTITLRNQGALTVADLSASGDAQVAGASGVRTADAADVATNQPITLATASGAITLNAPVNAGTATVRLGSGSGAISQNSAGTVIADALLARSGAAGTAISLDQVLNQVNTVALVGTGSVTYINGGAFTIGTVAGDALVAGASGATSSAGATGLASVGAITVAQPVNAATVARLRSTTGDVTQNAAGLIAAPQLYAMADSTQVDLTGAANAVGSVAGFGATGFRLTASGALAVVTDPGGGAFPSRTGVSSTNAPITLVSGGTLNLVSGVNAGTGGVRLRATAGDVTQGAAGTITAGDLAVAADAGQVLLTSGAANNATQVAGFGATGFRYLAAGALAVGTVAADGALTPAYDGIASTDAAITLRAAGTITANNPVDAGTGTVRLYSTGGSIAQGAGGNIVGGALLAVSDVGTIDLTTAPGNAVGALAAFAPAGISLRNDAPLTVAALAGDGALVAARSGLATTNTPITVVSNGAMTLDAAVAAGASIVRLRTESGAITQTAAGTLTGSAALLVGDAGAVDLTAAANDVVTLAGASVGGFAFFDASALTVGSVAGLGLVPGASGITSASPVSLLATGDLLLTSAVTAGTGAGATDIVRLRSITGDVSQTATGQVVAEGLLVRAEAGSVDLGLANAPNNVRTLAGVSLGGFVYRGLGALSIGTVTGDAQVATASGITTTNAPVTVVSDGIALDQPITAGTATVSLSATTGSISQGAGSVITAAQVLARADAGDAVMGQPNDANIFAGNAAGDLVFGDADGLTIGPTVTDPFGLVAAMAGMRAGGTATVSAGQLLPANASGPDTSLIVTGAGIDASGNNQPDGFGRILVRMSGGTDVQVLTTPATALPRIWAVDSSGGTFTAADLDRAVGSPARLMANETPPLLSGLNAGTDIRLGTLNLPQTDLYLFGRSTTINGGPIFVRALGVYAPSSSVVLSGAISGDRSGSAATFVTRSGDPSLDQRFNDCPIEAAACFVLPEVIPPSPVRTSELVLVLQRTVIDESTLTLINGASDDLVSRERRRRLDEEETGQPAAGGQAPAGSGGGSAR